MVPEHHPALPVHDDEALPVHALPRLEGDFVSAKPPSDPHIDPYTHHSTASPRARPTIPDMCGLRPRALYVDSLVDGCVETGAAANAPQCYHSRNIGGVHLRGIEVLLQDTNTC